MAAAFALDELWHPASATALERALHPAGHGPNSSSLLRPQAAVVAVAYSAEKLFYISCLSRPAGRSKHLFTNGVVTADGICWRWLPAGERTLSVIALRCQLVSFWHFVPPPPAGGVCQRESQERGGSASCLFFERVPRAWRECFLPLPLGEVSPKVTERAHPAPLRGAAAAAAEGPSNWRNTKKR